MNILGPLADLVVGVVRAVQDQDLAVRVVHVMHPADGAAMWPVSSSRFAMTMACAPMRAGFNLTETCLRMNPPDCLWAKLSTMQDEVYGQPYRPKQ